MAVLAYARLLAERASSACDGLQAVYLHGSSVLGGWLADRSDVDVLVVVADDPGGPVLAALTQALLATGPQCPGRDLECSVVSLSQARQPGPLWPFLLHLQAGSRGATQRVVSGDQSPGDPDLLMHYVVCRAAGWPVYGPPARQLIGTVPRAEILDYLAGELHWGLGHAPEAYAVLNACRALIFLTDRAIVSKIAGGEAALVRGTAPAAVVSRALGQQRGSAPDQPPAPDAVDFVVAVAAALRSATGHAEGDS